MVTGQRLSESQLGYRLENGHEPFRMMVLFGTCTDLSSAQRTNANLILKASVQSREAAYHQPRRVKGGFIAEQLRLCEAASTPGDGGEDPRLWLATLRR